MESWIVFAVQLALSLLTLSVVILSFVWLRSNTRDRREMKLLLERLATAFQQMRGDARPALAPPDMARVSARRGGRASAPIPLDTLTDSRRTAGLTVAMVLPVLQRRMVSVAREEDDEAQARPTRPEVRSPRPLVVQVGGEAIELDGDIVARLEALTEDMNAGQVDGALLQRVIEAGLGRARESARESVVQIARADDVAPITPITPTRPTGR